MEPELDKKKKIGFCLNYTIEKKRNLSQSHTFHINNLFSFHLYKLDTCFKELTFAGKDSEW